MNVALSAGCVNEQLFVIVQSGGLIIIIHISAMTWLKAFIFIFMAKRLWRLFQVKCWCLITSWQWRGLQRVIRWCLSPTTLRHWTSLKSCADLEGAFWENTVCDNITWFVSYVTNNPLLGLSQVPLCSTGWYNVYQEKGQDCGKIQQSNCELETVLKDTVTLEKVLNGI